ncbi:MAG: glycosyltransferase family 4 protein [Pseudomonadota bacterium]
MKILVISQYFWPENFRVNDLPAGLRDRGHEVTVLTGLPNYPEGKLYKGYSYLGPYTESLDGIRVVRVPMVPRGKKKGIRLALNFFTFSFFACFVALFRCREKYDAVFVWCLSPVTVSFSGLCLKWFRRIPVYNWVADLWPDTLSATGVLRKGMIMGAISRMSSFIYKQCDVNLIASEGYRSRLVDMGVRPDRIVYWPQWAESIYGKEVTNKNTVSFPDVDGFRVLYAGNIGASQGFDTILEAATLLKNEKSIHWVILGDGVLKKWFSEEIHARGLATQVHFLDPCPVDQVPDYAANADALLASLRKAPLFAITVPGKMQSCLALGKPIVGAFDGEAAQILESSGASFVAPSGDAQGLADAVLRMSRLPQAELDRMGGAGRQHFLDNFERELLFGKLEKILAT